MYCSTVIKLSSNINTLSFGGKNKKNTMILKLKARKWHKNGNSFYIENQNDIVLHVKKNVVIVVMIVSVIEHFWQMA